MFDDFMQAVADNVMPGKVVLQGGEVNELSAKNRAEELAEAIGRNAQRLPRCYEELTEVLGMSEASVQYECDLAKLIEQALLAERAIALTEASKMLVFLEREDESFEGTDDEFWNYAASEGVAQYRKHIKGLLATPRGGE